MIGIQSGNGLGWFPYVWGLVSKQNRNESSSLPAAIHFWPMNEGSGTTLFDHIGTTNLTVSNPVWQVTTGMGTSAVLAFNGTTTSAVAPAVDPTLNFNGVTPFAVSCWMVTSVSTAETFFGNLQASDGSDLGWELTTGGASGIGLILVNNINTTDENVFYLDGSPQPTLTPINVIMTYDGSNTLAGTKLYLNGVSTPLTQQSALNTPSFSSTQPFLIGARNNGTNLYTGAMAYVRIWNTVLTQAQISALYALGPQ